MLGYVVARTVQAVPIVFLVSVLLFLFLRALPGDPAALYVGADASPEVVAAVRRDMSLDQPLPVQYGLWLSHALGGDLGRSYANNFPVSTLIGGRLAATAQLALTGVVLGIVFGVPLGLPGALWPGSRIDAVVSMVTALLLGLPNFWLGLLLILGLGLALGWLPTSGRVDPALDPVGGVRHLVLPGLTLSLHLAAVIGRFLKVAVLDVLDDPFVRTARAKGLSERRVIVGHVLRNALPPVITVVGLQFSYLLGGAVVVEELFGWPGLGRLVLQAVGSRDYLVLQGVLLLLVMLFVVINLLTDLVHAVLDPRLRYGHSRP